MSAQQPLALTIKDACTLSGVSRTTIYEAIKAGALVARKCGNRTLIRHDDLKSWIDGFPKLDTASAA